MKKQTSLLILLLLAVSFSTPAQNLLSPEWKLTLNKGAQNQTTHTVNLLLSWERQGFCYLHPASELSNIFYYADNPSAKQYTLEFKLMADIQDIYINNHRVGGNIPAVFLWLRQPQYKTTKITVPKEYLNIGGDNSIVITCSNYSYTAGKSHNQVLLYADNQTSTSEVQLMFTPENHLFTDKSKVAFTLKTNADSNGKVKLLIRDDLHKTFLDKRINIKKGVQSQAIHLKNINLRPGLYEVTAILQDSGYTGTAAFFALSPTLISASVAAPKGYDVFWQDALRELRTVSPQYKIHKVDSLCTEKRDGYVVEMQSLGDKTIRCYYFVPKKPGKYAALLNFPGYGYGFEELNEFLKVQDDVIEMAVCVRGHGISKEALQVSQPSPGFLGYNICDVSRSAYRAIYMDCIRALEFVLTRPEVDKSRVGVLGGSQGGGLAIMTASLMPEQVKGLAYSDPFPVDLKTAREVRTLIKDEIKSYLKANENACSFETAVQNFEYLDTKYMVKTIQCPTYYITGLVDDDCPSRLGFTAYNAIKSPKQFKIFPNDSHIGESDWKKEMMLFFKKKFGF